MPMRREQWAGRGLGASAPGSKRRGRAAGCSLARGSPRSPGGGAAYLCSSSSSSLVIISLYWFPRSFPGLYLKENVSPPAERGWGRAGVEVWVLGPSHKFRVPFPFVT